jgi:cysteinyl-tRNA synthetase
MGLVFYNTLTRRKEEFSPIEPGKVRMYTCGPTVYDYPHIGNFRTFIFEDLLRRYLKYKGYQITQVMNLTDVDDRTIGRAREEKISLDASTKRYKKAFFEDLDSLNIQRAEVYPEATKHVPEMVEIIKSLLDKKHSYVSDGSIYFKISTFPEYGRLSNMNLSELKAGVRVSADDYEKEQVSDFALWKAWDEKDGEVFWETEIGKGRPGWHIECSAMSMKYLGPHFDIHTGGVDNIFPHHENEIAQSQAATGHKFVNYWLHSAHLLVDGTRMAKRLGNFYTLRDLLEQGWNRIAIRYLLISTHYRQQLNFTFDGLEASKNALQRLHDFTDALREIQTQGGRNPEIERLLEQTRTRFEASLDDDLNISGALAPIFDMVRDVNRLVNDERVSMADANLVLEFLDRADSVLGVMARPEVNLENQAVELIRQREQARAEKNWGLADKIRQQLLDMGIILEDTPDRTKWKKKI